MEDDYANVSSFLLKQEKSIILKTSRNVILINLNLEVSSMFDSKKKVFESNFSISNNNFYAPTKLFFISTLFCKNWIKNSLLETSIKIGAKHSLLCCFFLSCFGNVSQVLKVFETFTFYIFPLTVNHHCVKKKSSGQNVEFCFVKKPKK